MGYYYAKGAAGGGIYVSDNFVRANANPMSSPGSGITWSNGSTNFGNLQISGNLCAGTGAQVCVARVTTPGFTTVQRATITLYDTGISRGPRVRMQSSSNASGYFAQIGNDNVTLGLYKVDDVGGNGAYTTLGGGTVTLASPVVTGDTISLLANGNVLTVYHNGVLKITEPAATDYSGGAPGAQTYGSFQFASLFEAADS